MISLSYSKRVWIFMGILIMLSYNMGIIKEIRKYPIFLKFFQIKVTSEKLT